MIFIMMFRYGESLEMLASTSVTMFLLTMMMLFLMVLVVVRFMLHIIMLRMMVVSILCLFLSCWEVDRNRLGDNMSEGSG